MRTVSYKLADLGKVVIHLGKMAENDATQVRIDAAEVFSEYPNAVPALDVINPSGEAYTVEVTLDGTVIVWDVKDSSLTAEGNGEIQLTFTQDGTKVKSSICRTKVCRSITGGGTAPDPVQDWLDHANEVLEETGDALETLENMTASASALPAGSNPTATYHNGNIAFGIPKGDKGDTGAAGQNGVTPNVTAGTTTTGAAGTSASVTRRAGSPDSAPIFDFTIPKGDKGDHGDLQLDSTLTSASAAAPADQVGNLKSAVDVINEGTKDYKSEMQWSINADYPAIRYNDVDVPTGTIFTISDTNYLVGLLSSKGTGASDTWSSSVTTTGSKKYVGIRKTDSANLGSLTDSEINDLFESIVYTTPIQQKQNEQDESISLATLKISEIDDTVFVYTQKMVEWVSGFVNTGYNFATSTKDKVSKPIRLLAGETVIVKTKGDGAYNFTCISKVQKGNITISNGYPSGTSIQQITSNNLTTYTHTATEDEFIVLCVYDYDGTADVSFTNTIILPSFAKNNLINKKLGADGDSICYGHGFNGGYAGIIADENAMSLQNIAVSGGTIAYVNGKHCISRSMSDISSDCDYVIIEGGVNDGSSGVPLGEITSGFSSALDDTTFYGAMETVCKKLSTRFAGKKYGFIIPHQMSSYMNPNGTFYNAVKVCCSKWGVPCLDLAIEIPPFAAFGTSGDSDLIAVCDEYTADTGNTGHGDGWHPNEEGYKKYYVPKIVAWMNIL